MRRYWQVAEAVLDYRARFMEALDRDGIDVSLSPASSLPAFTHGAGLKPLIRRVE